jgi:uncharacterized OsmC-like protein
MRKEDDMYHVEINNRGDTTFQVKSKDYEFVVDTQGKGVTPPDTLLASLGTCIGVYLRKYTEGSKIDLKGFNVTVDAEFSEEAPICFREIAVNLDLQGVRLDETKKKALLNFIRNCPVHNTLEAHPDVKINVG